MKEIRTMNTVNILLIAVSFIKIKQNNKDLSPLRL